jgi:hypothetical protein
MLPRVSNDPAIAAALNKAKQEATDLSISSLSLASHAAPGATCGGDAHEEQAHESGNKPSVASARVERLDDIEVEGTGGRGDRDEAFGQLLGMLKTARDEGRNLPDDERRCCARLSWCM